MDRQQILQSFWGNFGVPAYEENSVPDDTGFPYITYEKIFASLDSPLSMSVNVWTRSSSWEQADTIVNLIHATLKNGGRKLRFDNGILWITLPSGGAEAQSMGDDTDTLVKRYFLNLAVEWLTA